MPGSVSSAPLIHHPDCTQAQEERASDNQSQRSFSSSSSPPMSLWVEAPREPRPTVGAGIPNMGHALRAMFCCCIDGQSRSPSPSHSPFPDYGATAHSERPGSAESISAINSDEMSSEEMDRRILNDVMEGLEKWDASLSEDISRYGGECKDDHRIMALFMNALYKRHLNGVFDVDKLPSEERLNAIFHGIVSRLREKDWLIDSFNHMEDLLKPDSQFKFRPKIAETFDVLNRQFNATPFLKDIPPEHRWRLLVDPVKIDVLERHGIDCNNPLLAFLFDGLPSDGGGYAYRLAKAWVATMSQVGSGPVTVEKAIEILSISCGHDYPLDPDGMLEPEGMKFGAYCSRDGMLRIADHMHSLRAEHGIKTELSINRNEWLTQEDDGTATKFRRSQHPGGEGREIKTLLETGSSVKALLEKEEFGREEQRQFLYRRYPIKGKDHKEKKENLTALMSGILEKVKHVEHLPPDKALSVIAKTYLDGEFLHGMKNANYRVWGLLMLNLLLAKAGLSMSIIKNPFISDGGSVEEVVDMIKEGQFLFAKWLAIQEERQV